jgi:caffeoyl-CoA O-methyltransferase
MEIQDYCLRHSTSPSALAKELETLTRASVPGSNMLIGELEGSLLRVLLRLGKVRTVLELGTFTGYSALVMAEALPADGRILTLDVNPGTTKIAQSFWDRSPHGHKIQAVLRPATEYLPQLHETFDFVFIDADKVNYPFYVTWAHGHLNAGGMIVVDNALWSGRVVEENPDAHTRGILEASRLATSWRDCATSLLPIRDGMLLIQKVSL